MKNLKELTKIESKHCFTKGKDGIFIPEYLNLWIRILNEDGSIKHYHIKREKHGTRLNSINTYTRKTDKTFYSGEEDNKRFKVYTDEEFDKKLDKLSKELENKNIIFQNLTEQDIIK